MAHRLSKSKLQSHAQCPKRFWLELHAKELAEEDDASQLVFDRGNAFGEAVRSLFPNGVLIDTLDTRDALARTARCLAAFDAGQPKVPLFEAAFQYENVLVRVDVLEPQPDGRWRLVEVKSGMVKPGEAPKATYVRDAAIQAFVLERCGFPVAAIELGTPSPDFTLESLQSIEGLLARHDITSEARGLFVWVQASMAEATVTAASTLAPEIPPDSQCKDPYPCPFIAHCTGAQLTGDETIRVPVWHLAGSPTAKIVRDLMHDYRDLADVPESRLAEPMHKIMRKVARNELAGWIDPGLKAWLRAQPFPRYFLDYEFIGSPLPIWRGTRAGERIAFQASVHIWRSPDDTPEHHEFIAESLDDPRPQLARALASWMAQPGPVFAWAGKSVEAPITEGLAQFFPAGAEVLKRVAQSCRTHDPLPVFREGLYLPAMAGDWGLKAVSNALLGENRYAQLKIRNGVEAMRGYERLVALPAGAERERKKQDLLDYCKLDTAIMVDLWKAVLSFAEQSASTIALPAR
jgi:hypothetical protein